MKIETSHKNDVSFHYFDTWSTPERNNPLTLVVSIFFFYFWHTALNFLVLRVISPYPRSNPLALLML